MLQRVICLVLVATAAASFARSPLQGPTFGRGDLTDPEAFGPIIGTAQQTINLSPKRQNFIVSTLSVFPITVNDTLFIRGRQLTFQTDYSPCGCGDPVTALGRITVRNRTIRYFAQDPVSGLVIQGRMRQRGPVIDRFETRTTSDGEVATINYRFYRISR